jgi:biotin carboxyl carrier protein
VTIGDAAAVEAKHTSDRYIVSLPDPKATGSVEVIFAINAKKGDESRDVRPAVSLIGRIIGDPNHTSIVQSIYGGRVVPNAKTLPRIGQKVTKGETLVQIEPYLPVADRTTISEKMGEIEQLIAVAETKINRLRPLAERGAAPMGQLNDLESELAGLRARRETLRNSRGGYEFLRAPTDGIITAAKAVPGQVVQPQDVLFEIADPQGLWVEALAYDGFDTTPPVQATAATSGGAPLTLSYLGASRTLRQHASVVHFSIPEPPTDLNIQIEQAVTRFGTNSGGGFVDQHGREFLIRNVGLTRKLEDLGNTVVGGRDHQPILLKQMARVDFAPRVKRGVRSPVRSARHRGTIVHAARRRLHRLDIGLALDLGDRHPGSFLLPSVREGSFW